MDSQFWTEVEQAYRMVNYNQERQVVVAREGKEAHVGYMPNSGGTMIFVREVDTRTKEPLIKEGA